MPNDLPLGMYPPLPPVEVGEWLRFDSSGDPDHDFVQVDRLTKKLIWCGKEKFSREHGALLVEIGLYDAYAGRVRKLTPENKVELDALLAGNGL